MLRQLRREYRSLFTELEPEGSAPAKHSKPSAKARYAGSATAAAVLVPFNLPIDTMVKRLQINNHTIIATFEDAAKVNKNVFSASLDNAYKVIFRDAYNKSVFDKLKSLYGALWIDMSYTIVQRTYKFGTQPIAVDLIDKKFGARLRQHFKEPTVQTIEAGAGGGVLSIAEPFVVGWWDNIKTKVEAKEIEATFKGVFSTIGTEKFALLNGAPAAVVRNVPGTFALFSVPAYVHHHFFKLEKSSDATFWQNMMAASLGGLACAVITNPADVIKNRVQRLVGKGYVSTFSVFRKTCQEEGIKAFGKGIFLRSLSVVPKLTAVRMLTDHFSNQYQQRFFNKEREVAAPTSQPVKPQVKRNP